LQRLHAFCVSHKSGQRRATSELVCADKLEDAKASCLRGECHCGFQALLGPVHAKLVWEGPAGKLRPEASRVWLTDLKWNRIKTGGDGNTSPLDVAEHLRATFFTQECLSEHIHMKINQFVVMYLDVDEISRPVAPPDVSPCKIILSSYSFLFLGTPQHYAMRPYSCWCNACSRVRG